MAFLSLLNNGYYLYSSRGEPINQQRDARWAEASAQWCNIPISLKMPAKVVLSDNAFHEKAGRSQVDSFGFFMNKFFLPPSEPLSPCFHPHSRGANRFARCMLGVLVSAGAAT
jgi:hypothetical protein